MKNKRFVFEEGGEGVGNGLKGDERLEDEENETKRKRKRKRVKSSELSEESEEKVKVAKVDTLQSATSYSPPTGAAAAFANDCTVYIEGLPFESNEAQVREFFKAIKSGDILSVRLPTWQDSGRLRGYGHVEFNKPLAAKDALKLDGSYMGKRFIKVTTPMVPRTLQIQEKRVHATIVRPPGCRTIFVKNLPYDTTEEEITESFKVFGKIQTVRIPVWGHTNQQKGVAYLDFKREDSAEIAVKKGMTVRGRPLMIDFETGAPKLSFKVSKNFKSHSE